MAQLLRLPRFLGVLSVVFCTIVFTSLVGWLSPSLIWARRLQTKWVSIASKMCLFFLQVRILRNGEIPTDQTILIVSNHLSYVDILVISSFFPTCYVTSDDVKNSPFLGTLTQSVGCLFVDRRSRAKLTREIEDVAEVLKQGQRVTIFPEATSTDGSNVLKFRRLLYRSAVLSQVPVLPLCLNYQKINDEPVTNQNRDLLFWYGEMTFFDHLWSLAGQKGATVEVSFLPLLNAENQGESSLADESFNLVSEAFRPIQ